MRLGGFMLGGISSVWRSGWSNQSWVDWARDKQVWGMGDGQGGPFYSIWGFSIQLRTLSFLGPANQVIDKLHSCG